MASAVKADRARTQERDVARRPGDADGGSAAPRPLPWRSSAAAVSTAALIASDVVAFAMAAAVATLARFVLRGPMPLSPGVWIGGGVLWLALRAHSRLYPGFGLAPPEELRRSTVTTFVAALGQAATLFALKEVGASRFLTLGTWLLLAPLAWLFRRATTHALLRLRLFGYPAIVAGSGREALAVRALRANPDRGLVPVAIFDDNPTRHGTYVEGVPVLGSLSDALDWRFAYPVRHAVLAVSDAGERFAALAQTIARRYPTLEVLPELAGIANLCVHARPLGAYIALEVEHARFNARKRRLKRAFDFVLGVPLFVASLPIIAFAALLVKLFSPGPAFFWQPREGLDGRRIRVWKIRTMVPDAEGRLAHHLSTDATARTHWEQFLKLRRDPRVIPKVGALLRRSSIDELPQLWNVVAGQMSLVGPRPFPDYHLERFPAAFRELRRQVPPGITGLWQITHRSDGDLGLQESSDSYYIQNWSIWLDIWILLRTVAVVVSAKGAY